jgi:hypothetical protein
MKTVFLLTALAGAAFANQELYNEPASMDRLSTKRLPDSLFTRTSEAMKSAYEKPTDYHKLYRKAPAVYHKKIFAPYKNKVQPKMKFKGLNRNQKPLMKPWNNYFEKMEKELGNKPLRKPFNKNFEMLDKKFDQLDKKYDNKPFNRQAKPDLHAEPFKMDVPELTDPFKMDVPELTEPFIRPVKQHVKTDLHAEPFKVDVPKVIKPIKKPYVHHPVRANMKLSSKEPDYVEKDIHINTGSTDSAVPPKHSSNSSSASTALYILGGLVGVVCAVAGVLMAVRPKGIKKRRSAMDTKPGMVYAKYNLDNVFEPSVSAPIPIVRRSDPQQRYPDVSLDLDVQRMRNMPSMASMNESVASEYSPFDGRPLSYISDKTERA